MSLPRSLIRSGLLAALIAAQLGCAGNSASRRPGEEAPSRRRTVLTAEDISSYPNIASLEQVLVQHIPGLQLVTRHDGSMTLSIMGISNVGRTALEPLYVIDGVPRSFIAGRIEVNPQDVEWVEVLKDGGALAMYGFQGANGVIVIRTKRGIPLPVRSRR
jgi:TonB-dependent SusC/RagA subfamily outer membrane receptor